MTSTAREAALSALEWGKVVSRLCFHASSGPGRERCTSLMPGTDLEAIRISLEENRNGRRMLAEDGPLPLEGAEGISEQAGKAVKGASLTPPELLAVGRTARAGERVRRFFEDRRGKYPRLAHHAREIPRLKELADEIETKIESSGVLTDGASPVLGPLRRQLAEVRNRLQKTADEILASPKYARHVQESYATVRSGRLVIPFKTAAKGLFQGIVHDTSQSGQTVFFEPEELVWLNNEVRMAELEVEREIARILAELTGQVGRRAEDLAACVERLALLDFAQARSLLAEELRASEPTVGASGEVNLLAARHPLLVLGRREVVPNDLRLGRPAPVLVLTGPNAGGKTVALKTLGLLTLMAMAGLSIPAAADSSVSVFPRIFATLGDEQSVEQDLSTFSAHVRRLNEILSGADRDSLVLLDEVVSGTDPREGAAIARAFLETLADRGARVVATTHFEELKGIAYEDPRFENGSMAFDDRRLRPTYRLLPGIPGRSMGITIARSLGFPEEVLARSEKYLSGSGQELANALSRLSAEQEKAKREASEAAEARREAEALRDRLSAERERIGGEESRILSGARQKVREEIRKAEAQLRAVTEELRRERKIETVRKAQSVIREWKETGRAEEDPVVRGMISRTAPLPPGGVLRLGQKVYLTTILKEAEVASLPAPGDREVEVLAGGLRLRVALERIRVFPAEARERETGPAKARRREEPAAAPYPQTSENTLDIRGKYVDEAMAEVDAFLDRLSLSQAPHAFVIHGHGTGALKAAVRSHLKGSPYARSSFPAPREQGGDGVTIVLL